MVGSVAQPHHWAGQSKKPGKKAAFALSMSNAIRRRKRKKNTITLYLLSTHTYFSETESSRKTSINVYY